MLTEEELPVILQEVNSETGCAKAVYRTAIKRDGVLVHIEYRYEDIMCDSMKNELAQIIESAGKAVKAKLNGEQVKDEI